VDNEQKKNFTAFVETIVVPMIQREELTALNVTEEELPDLVGPLFFGNLRNVAIERVLKHIRRRARTEIIDS